MFAAYFYVFFFNSQFRSIFDLFVCDIGKQVASPSPNNFDQRIYRQPITFTQYFAFVRFTMAHRKHQTFSHVKKVAFSLFIRTYFCFHFSFFSFFFLSDSLLVRLVGVYYLTIHNRYGIQPVSIEIKEVNLCVQCIVNNKCSKLCVQQKTDTLILNV